jgi:hypothetical protein
MRKQFHLVLLFVPWIICIFGTLYVGLAADDYCLGVSVRDHGAVGTMILYYQQINGRFAYHVATSIASLLPFIGFPALITLVIWPMALLDIGRKLEIRPELALVVFIAFLGVAANLIQVLYWRSAVFVYGFNLALFCILVAFIIRQAPLAVCAILAFLISGFSETLGVAQIALFSMCVIWSLWDERSPVTDKRRQLIAAIAGACVGFIGVYFAPGTAARRLLVSSPDVNLALFYAARAWILPVVTLIRQQPGILIALFIIPWGFSTYEKNPTIRRQIRVWMLFSLISVSVVNFLCFLLGYISAGVLIPERAQSIPMFFTIIEIVFLAYGTGRIVPVRLPKAVALAFLILLVGLSSARAFETLNKLREYAQLSDERDRMLKAGNTQITTIDSDYAPGGDLGDAQTPDKLWVNGCMADYYGVEKIDHTTHS